MHSFPHSFRRIVRDSYNKTGSHGYLQGKILVSMPYMQDLRFHQTIIYVCGHDTHGAIGLIVNKILPGLTFLELLVQLDITPVFPEKKIPLHYGGPIEVSRGFVLHSPDYQSESAIAVDDRYSITATLDILRSLVKDDEPKNYLLALGYVGWEPGQLESEVQDNMWMIIDAYYHIVFNNNTDTAWRTAMATIGVDPAVLTLEAGRA